MFIMIFIQLEVCLVTSQKPFRHLDLESRIHLVYDCFEITAAETY